MNKLMHFAESQKNIDWVATRLGAGGAVFGVLVAAATVIAMIAR